MSTRECLDGLYDLIGLNRVGRRMVERIRRSDPVRRVRAGRNNVAIRYPSTKMGCVIQAESRTTEYPFVLSCEFDHDVVEYWDQPASLRVSYRNRDRKKITHLEIPDFLVIRSTGIQFVECKTLTDLRKLSEMYIGRFECDAEGRWRSPAGQAAAAEFGLNYEVFHPELLSPYLVRNTVFLSDYLAKLNDPDTETRCQEIRSIVAVQRIITLRDLWRFTEDRDAIYLAILRGDIFFDLAGELLCRPDAARVYSDPATAEADKHTRSAMARPPLESLELREGTRIRWRKSDWEIVAIDGDEALMRSEGARVRSWAIDDLMTLVGAGEVQITGGHGDSCAGSVLEPLAQAHPEELEVANARMQLLRRGDGRAAGLSERTLRRYRERYRNATVLLGVGYLGLLPQTRLRGNRSPRLNPDQYELIEHSIEQDFLSPMHRSFAGAYARYRVRCRRFGVPHCSYNTYCAYAKRLSPEERLARRRGWKAADQARHGPSESDAPVLSPHGDRPWEVGHIDHTELDIALVSELTGEVLGRIWLTVLIDGRTRAILAHSISFEAPSHRSLMLVLRDCVRRHGRLPSAIVCDQGAEFQSTYYEALLAAFRIEKRERPAGKPRFGSPVERILGTLTTELLHHLGGNTQLNKMGRATSDTHEPGLHAVWTPDNFAEVLERWLYDVYPQQTRGDCMEAPSALMTRLQAEDGPREVRRIPYTREFVIATLPAPSRPTRRIRPGRPVMVNHLAYYSPELDSLPQPLADVQVRCDPYDLTYVYVLLPSGWSRLSCRNPVVQELKERGIRLSHLEVSALAANAAARKRAPTPELLDFIQSLISDEKAQLTQRQALLLGEYHQKQAQPAPANQRDKKKSFPLEPVRPEIRKLEDY